MGDAEEAKNEADEDQAEQLIHFNDDVLCFRPG